MLDLILNFQRQLNSLQVRINELAVLMAKKKISLKDAEACLAECNQKINLLIKKYYGKEKTTT